MGALGWKAVLLVLFGFSGLSGATAVAAESGDVEALKRQGELIIDDPFNRAELGEQWHVNDGRARRAGSDKSQAQLSDGVLEIRRAAQANHGASVRTAVEFTDGVIEVKFRLSDEGDTFAVNLNDTDWGKRQTPKRFGHLWRVGIGAEGLLIEDQKSAGLAPEFLQLKQSGVGKEERVAWKERNTRRRFPVGVTAEQWHELTIAVVGDRVRVFFDGDAVGQHRAEGFAHPTKRLVAFAVPEAVDIDALKIWKLR